MTARNGPTWRQCPECRGAGEHVTYARDPQDDTATNCPECGGGGWVTWLVRDPLLVVADLRARRNRSDRAARLYGEARQRAASPVPLPRDRHRHDPLCPVATVYDAMGSRP